MKVPPWAFGILLICGAAACRGGSGAATPTPSPPPSSTPVDKAVLAGSLLDTSDLGSGWVTRDGRLWVGPESLCGVPLDGNPTVVLSFLDFRSGAALDERISAHRPGDAKTVMTRIVGASCKKWNELAHDALGDWEVVWEPAPMSFPSFGDETYAVQVTARLPHNLQVDFGEEVVDFVFVRIGDYIIVVNNLRKYTTPRETLESADAVSRAVAKFLASPLGTASQKGNP